MFEYFKKILTQEESETLAYLGTLKKSDLNALDENNKSLLLVALELYKILLCYDHYLF